MRYNKSMPEQLPDISWSALEHSHTDKGADWFWAFGIVAASSAVVAILFQNFLFALLIVVGALTLAMLSMKPPSERTFTLTQRGIMIENVLYPYKMLVAFGIEERESEVPLLIVDARKVLTPHLLIPLEGVPANDVRDYLAQYLPEEELHEPFAQRLAEIFGL
ncbi:MAG: hypothetical protein Q8P16_00035 [bacterium]|nr:hypothetical protein [bacterium]